MANCYLGGIAPVLAFSCVLVSVSSCVSRDAAHGEAIDAIVLEAISACMVDIVDNIDRPKPSLLLRISTDGVSARLPRWFLKEMRSEKFILLAQMFLTGF